MPPTCTAIGQLSEVASTGTTRLYSDYGYDSATGLLISAQCTTNTGTTHASIADRAYSRDNAGNITEAATTSATTATDTQCYAYDHLSELTAAWTPSTGDCTAAPSASALGGPAPYLDQYTYDTGTGNRLSASTVNGAVSTQQVYAYPAADTARPHAVSTVTSTGSSNGTSTYGYDTAGDTTTRPGQTLTYDPSGRLAAVKAGTSTQSEVYDACGTLLLRTDPTGSTLFLGETELHQGSGSANVSAVRTYTLAGKVIGERTTQPGVTGNGTLAWLGTDVDGTADVEVDSVTGHVTGRYSDPFGNSRGSIPAWSSDHGFLNKTDDTSTGLTQLGARAYDATIGKFLTVDPILAPGNPVQNNGYTYSANNPITLTDPDGKCFVGTSDSFNFHTTCSTGVVNKKSQLTISYGNVAAPGPDNGRVQGFAAGSRPGRAAYHKPVLTDAMLDELTSKLHQVSKAKTYMAAGTAPDQIDEANWLARQTLELAIMLPFAFEGMAVGPDIEGGGQGRGASARSRWRITWKPCVSFRHAPHIQDCDRTSRRGQPREPRNHQERYQSRNINIDSRVGGRLHTLEILPYAFGWDPSLG